MNDTDLVPFIPPERPLGLFGLPTFLRNYVETFPRAAYEEETARITTILQDTLLVCDPKLIEEILVDRDERFGRDVLTIRAIAPLGGGESSLFLAERANWRWQRRAVAPIFRHEELLKFVPVFAEMAARQVARWQQAPKNAPVEVFAAMSQTTLEIIVETMLGGLSFQAKDYGATLTDAFDATLWHMTLAMFGLPRWMPFPGRRRATKASLRLQRQMGRIIADRRAKTSPRRDGSDLPDLLDLLLKAHDTEIGRSMSDNELVNNLLTFINAGHETTATALTWTLWLIARDDALQRQLAGEVSSVAGDAPIGADQLEKLALCRQAIQEAMRLFPPAPAISRQARAGTEIGGHRITMSTHVVIPIYALHRHVKLWRNPNSFDLNRFAPEETKARPRYAYLPFGGGQRICIGWSFALMEATVILATLLRAFRFRGIAGHKARPMARISLRPERGMPLYIAPR